MESQEADISIPIPALQDDSNNDDVFAPFPNTTDPAPADAALPPKATEDAPLPTQVEASTALPEATPEEGQAGDAGLFDDTFDDLDNMDDGHGDESLLDFDGMGMDDSAFGDAMHGMDERTPGDGGDM